MILLAILSFASITTKQVKQWCRNATAMYFSLSFFNTSSAYVVAIYATLSSCKFGNWSSRICQGARPSPPFLWSINKSNPKIPLPPRNDIAKHFISSVLDLSGLCGILYTLLNSTSRLITNAERNSFILIPHGKRKGYIQAPTQPGFPEENRGNWELGMRAVGVSSRTTTRGGILQTKAKMSYLRTKNCIRIKCSNNGWRSRMVKKRRYRGGSRRKNNKCASFVQRESFDIGWRDFSLRWVSANIR